MTGPQEKAIRVRLECEHDLWLKIPYPQSGELLWCVKCDDYKQVGPTKIGGKTYEPDYDWAHTYDGRRFTGECQQCPETKQLSNYYRLRDHFERHYLRRHSGSSLIGTGFQRTPIPVPKRGTPPPF